MIPQPTVQPTVQPSLVARLASTFAYTSRLNGPVWKISENHGSDDDVATHMALRAFVAAGVIEEKWADGQPVWLRLRISFTEHDIAFAEHVFARALEAYSAT